MSSCPEVASPFLKEMDAQSCHPEGQSPEGSLSLMKNWYAVYTRSRHEDFVEDQLRGKGLSPFLPKLRVWSRRRDRRQQILKPLFPGYLFVHMAAAYEFILEVLKTRGVVHILGNKQGPFPVPRSQVESIQILLGSDRVVESYQYLSVGDRISIAQGPLFGAEGILLKVDDQKRKLVVSVDIFQRAIAVELNPEDVEKLVA